MYSYSDNKPDQSPIEMVYLAAKEKNKEKLNHALRFVWIDVLRGKEVGTPLTQLAMENDKESVNFLIQFGASLKYAALGFALGGHEIEEKFLEEAKRKGEIVQVLKMVVNGFAQGKHLEKLNAFLETVKEKSEYSQHRVSILCSIARGFAASGCEQDRVNKLIKEMEQNYPNDLPSLLEEIAYGFSRGGHETKAYAFLEQIEQMDNVEYLTGVLKNMAMGFARGGYPREIDAFLKKVKKNKKYSHQTADLLYEAAYYFAQGGYEEEASRLIKEIEQQYPNCFNSTLMDVANNLFDGGHKIKGNVFLEKVKQEYPKYWNNVLPDVVVCVSRIEPQGEKFAFFERIMSHQDYCMDRVDILNRMTYCFYEKGGNKLFEAFLKKVKNDYPADFNDILHYVPCCYVGLCTPEKFYPFLKVVEGQYPDHIQSVLSNFARILSLKYEKEVDTFLETVKENKEYAKYTGAVLKSVVRSLCVRGDEKIRDAFLKRVRKEYTEHFCFVLNCAVAAISETKSHQDAYTFLNKIKEKNPEYLDDALCYMGALFYKRGILDAFLEGVIEKGYPNRTCAILKLIVDVEREENKNVDKAVVLKALVRIESPNLRQELALDLKELIKSYDPPVDLVERASKLRRKIDKHKITCNQVFAWMEREVQFVLIQSTLDRKKDQPSPSNLLRFLKLYPFVLPLIMTFLTPLSSAQVGPLRDTLGKKTWHTLYKEGLFSRSDSGYTCQSSPYLKDAPPLKRIG